MSEGTRTRSQSQKRIYNTRYRKRKIQDELNGTNKQTLMRTNSTNTIKPIKTLKRVKPIKTLKRVKHTTTIKRVKSMDTLKRVKSLTPIKKSEYRGEIIKILSKDAELLQRNTKTGIATYKHTTNINPYFYFNIEMDETADYLIFNKRQYYFVRYQNGELVDVQDNDFVFLRCDDILLESNKYDSKTIKEKLNTQDLNVKFKYLYCDTGFNISNNTIVEYTNKLNELNSSIHTKCVNLTLSVDLNYLSCNQIKILLKSGEDEVAYVLIKHIYDDDNILFNSSTNKDWEGKGYNKLLRAATILLCPSFIDVSVVSYITSRATDITSIYVFMKYFNGFVPKNFQDGDNEEFFNFFNGQDNEDNIKREITYTELEEFKRHLLTNDGTEFNMVYLKVPIKDVQDNARSKFEEFLIKFKEKNCIKNYTSAE